MAEARVRRLQELFHLAVDLPAGQQRQARIEIFIKQDAEIINGIHGMVPWSIILIGTIYGVKYFTAGRLKKRIGFTKLKSMIAL